MKMTLRLSSLAAPALAAMLALAPLAGAAAQPRADQDAALESRQAGRAMPLRQIEQRVIRQMRGADYMGNPIYFEDRNTYRMTFMRGGQVIRVEVDARSGRITDRTDR